MWDRHEPWPFSFGTESFRHDPHLFDTIVEIAMLLSLVHIAGLQVHMLAAEKSQIPNCCSMRKLFQQYAAYSAWTWTNCTASGDTIGFEEEMQSYEKLAVLGREKRRSRNLQRKRLWALWKGLCRGACDVGVHLESTRKHYRPG